jgi:flagellar hook-basal body complex protein FliE
MIQGVSALSAVKTADPSMSVSGASAAPSTGTDFGSVLSQFASDAIGSLQAGESAAIQGIQGAAPPFKVVEAVMEAQRTLQSALAIRDKAVSAFQEVTRMAI